MRRRDVAVRVVAGSGWAENRVRLSGGSTWQTDLRRRTTGRALRHLGRREHMSDIVQAVAGLLAHQQTADLTSAQQI
ncbi:hypothetical protein [Streptomyces hirsutus]|uniref:hypothetical protein n=1 Tax=Streptomyces hirsutus TaxID=35620 RepID=UPI003316A57E